MVLNIGTCLGGRYEIISKIGSGGMSDVFKALDHKLNRYIAIKVLKEDFAKDVSFVGKFRMEAQSAACLSNPNIVNIYDVGNDGDIHYIIMELIDGITLKRYIERRGRLGIREAIEVAMQVAYGLEAAHSEHIVHRDIKPQNIMITREGKVKVTDFGIARATFTQTISSNTMGSVHYISPEQAKGGYTDARSDIYSLGITMYEMLTGRVPYEGNSSVAVALAHISGEMVPPSKYEPLIPISLEKIIFKCTQKDAGMRYSSASELVADLKKSLTSPNEDFIKIVPSAGPELPFTGDVLHRQNNAERAAAKARRDEENYQLGREAADDEIELDDDELDEEEETEGRFEKLVTYIGIGIGAIIVIALIFFGLKMFGIFDGPGDPEEQLSTEAPVKMISLLGMTYEQADQALSDIGLHIKATYDTNNAVNEGEIFDQDVAVGTEIEAGTVINVIISSGQNAIMVPYQVEGLPAASVKSTLLSSGFTNVSDVFIEEYSDSIPSGLVIRTDPASGTYAPKNAAITIVVSKGRAVKTVIMPDIELVTEEQAKSVLRSFGLSVGTITEEFSSSVKEGLVISQSPKSGTEVNEGSSVDFVISKGSNEITVPGLEGDTLDDARAKLRSAGLVVGAIEYESSSEHDKGLVIGQSIIAGKTVDKGTAIDIIVGEGPEPTSPSESSESTESTENTESTEST